jgi:hypothetical protein
MRGRRISIRPSRATDSSRLKTVRATLCVDREAYSPMVRHRLLALPGFHRTRGDREKRVRLETGHIAPPAMKSRAACLQLAQQMLPLVLDLASAATDMDVAANRTGLGSVERVTARIGLEQNGAEISADGRARSRMGLEPLQLRMLAIAFGRAAKNRTRQECFLPQSHKALRIEVSG